MDVNTPAQVNMCTCCIICHSFAVGRVRNGSCAVFGTRFAQFLLPRERAHDIRTSTTHGDEVGFSFMFSSVSAFVRPSLAASHGLQAFYRQGKDAAQAGETCSHCNVRVTTSKNWFRTRQARPCHQTGPGNGVCRTVTKPILSLATGHG